jgi:hypothetical protein
MPKVRMLAPATDADGNPLAAGAVVDVSDDVAAALRADGKASLIEDEEAAEKRTREEGVYNARTAREDAPTPPPPPAEEQEEQPPKGKK